MKGGCTGVFDLHILWKGPFFWGGEREANIGEIIVYTQKTNQSYVLMVVVQFLFVAISQELFYQGISCAICSASS